MPGRRARGRGAVAHFFTELWDDDSDDPFVDLHYYDLLKVWRTFDQPVESPECGPYGRNIQDFRERFQALAPLYGLAEAATYDLPR